MSIGSVIDDLTAPKYLWMGGGFESGLAHDSRVGRATQKKIRPFLFEMGLCQLVGDYP